MAYDANLEAKIDTVVAGWEVSLSKKKMFSGFAYFVNGNMCFAIRGDELLLRLDNTQADELLKIPGVHVAVMGKWVMKNWLQAGGDSLKEPTFSQLLTIGRDYAFGLPPK